MSRNFHKNTCQFTTHAGLGHRRCDSLPALPPIWRSRLKTPTKKRPRNAISLGATNITGEEQDDTSYQVEKASSPKYTAPLVDTPRSVTVVPQQVLKDTGATSAAGCLAHRTGHHLRCR